MSGVSSTEIGHGVPESFPEGFSWVSKKFWGYFKGDFQDILRQITLRSFGATMVGPTAVPSGTRRTGQGGRSGLTIQVGRSTKRRFVGP